MDDISWKPGRGSPHQWSAEQRARLRALVLEGWPYRAIAAEFCITRNAVVGMAWRMGLSTPRGPAKPRDRRARIRKPWKPKPKPKPEDPAMIAAMTPSEPSQEPEEALGVAAVDFMRLESTTCRWPLWDGWARVPFGKQYYCGAPILCDGRPYCGEHTRVAYARAQGPGMARVR